ncbi:MAG: DUF4394 domain-containing protein [Solirubrobacteraceae bacterium]|nr:DUF4394 domain-containing protein [Solirubrobacteraceae bacterium]
MHLRHRLIAIAAATLTIPVLTAGSAAAADQFAAVTDGTKIVRFTSDAPNATKAVNVRGLQPNETLVGLDIRPANGKLVGLGSTGRIYDVSAFTGQVRPLGEPFTPTLDGESFGFDFNPTVDRIRITSDANQDLRLVPDTGQVAFVDGTLTYGPGDQNFGRDPLIVGSAYTNPDTDPATGTALFNLDAARDSLILQDPPNAGGLKTVGALGVNIGADAGFDIGASGVAYAAVMPRGAKGSVLYTVNLQTGAATRVKRIGPNSVGRMEALTVIGTTP